MNGGFLKNLILHIKYPYTAAIIAIMWIGMAILIGLQQSAEIELLIVATAVCSLTIAIIGFTSPK
ncbi:MAG: hypothetical protein LBL84_02925 [Candidatus Nomurabacteria bacterium]|jgi:hypothetical protein|nr:hypothetical protein [Candidatus Nomurabacteria bacterium]